LQTVNCYKKALDKVGKHFDRLAQQSTRLEIGRVLVVAVDNVLKRYGVAPNELQREVVGNSC